MTYLALNGPHLAMDRTIRATRLIPEIVWYQRKRKDDTSIVRFYLSNGADRNQVYKVIDFWASSGVLTRKQLVEESVIDQELQARITMMKRKLTTSQEKGAVDA